MNTKKFELITRMVLSVSLMFSSLPLYAAWGEIPDNAAYSFGPEGKPIESVREIEGLGRPKDMVSIIPDRPVAARDKDGNRLFFTPDGKMTLTISPDGKMQFSLSAQTIDRDAMGKLEKTITASAGSGKEAIKNEQGDTLGFQVMGLGGKVVAQQDAQGNLTQTTHFNQYGKTTQYVMDELTQTKTVFNASQQPVKDIDFEGNQCAWYSYNDQNKLATKTDINGNVTHYDSTGLNMTYTEDCQGNKSAIYHYKKDPKGNDTLDYVESPMTQDKTYFDNGRQTVTKNYTGTVTDEYKWDGTKLVYCFNHETKETTWYDINGKPTYSSLDNVETKQWLYYNGQLVGQWNQADNTTLIYKNQREEVTVQTGSTPPTPEEIKQWVADGIIEEAKNVGTLPNA